MHACLYYISPKRSSSSSSHFLRLQFIWFLLWYTVLCCLIGRDPWLSLEVTIVCRGVEGKKKKYFSGGVRWWCRRLGHSERVYNKRLSVLAPLRKVVESERFTGSVTLGLRACPHDVPFQLRRTPSRVAHRLMSRVTSSTRISLGKQTSQWSASKICWHHCLFGSSP